MNSIKAFLLAIGTTSCYGQLNARPATVGDCNATAIGKNVTVTVNCAAGLSHADAEKFALQFEEILSKINKTDNTTSLILSKLSLLSKKPNLVNNTASTQNGIANAGGTIINSPVTFLGVVKPPPQIKWEQHPRIVQYEDPQSALKSSRGITPSSPVKVEHAAVTVTLQDDFQNPAFLVTCDKPCSVVGVSLPMPGSIEIADGVSPPNTYLVVVRYPRSFTKDIPVFLEVAPRTGERFHLLNVESAMVP